MHALLPRLSGTVHDFSRVTSISWWFCSSRTTSFAAFLLRLTNKNISWAPHLPYLTVMWQCNSSSTHSIHLFRPRPQHNQLVARSFMALCAPQTDTLTNYSTPSESSSGANFGCNPCCSAVQNSVVKSFTCTAVNMNVNGMFPQSRVLVFDCYKSGCVLG